MTGDPAYDKPLFTYAADTHIGSRYRAYRNIDNNDYNTHQALLLFENKVPFAWKDITSDPLPAEILLYPYLMYHAAHNNYIIAASSIKKTFLESFENKEPRRIITVHSPTEVTPFEGQKMYTQCKHPHKHILNCDECIEQIPVDDAMCEVKSILYRRQHLEDTSMDMEEAREVLVHKKTRIGPFTMVSPVLTSDKCISSSYRPIEYHDFDRVKENSAIRKQACAERKRFKLFQREVCCKCMVKSECDHLEHGATNWIRRGCDGPIEGTEHQVAQRIVRQVVIPYTGKQLMILLQNSGELSERYNRRKYVLTFKTQYRNSQTHLIYGLNRYTCPGEFIPFHSYQEAINCIENYKRRYCLEPNPVLSTIQKATLVELANRDWSPTIQAGWHSTSYPTLGLTYRPGYGFTQEYAWNRGGTLPWNVNVSTLTDCYAHFANFSFAQRTSSPTAYRRY